MTKRYVNPTPGYVYKSGDKIYFYETGTTTPLDTYSDSAGTTPNTNPVIVPSSNIVPDIFLQDQDYKVRTDNAADVVQWTRDPVNFDDTIEPFASWDSTQSYSVGDIVTGSDQLYYKSSTNSNSGNDPVSDDDNWSRILIPQLSSTSLAVFQNLVAKYVSATTADIDADIVQLENTVGDIYSAASVNVTVDITSGGANGLDTGTEANSTWYYLWVIYNGTTSAGLLSISSTSPTMPSGYTYKGLVGAIYNNSSGSLVKMLQIGNEVMTKYTQVLTNGAATSTSPTTAIDLSAVIPDLAKEVIGVSQINTIDSVYGYSTNTTDYLFLSHINVYTSTEIDYPFRGIMDTAQTMYYRVSSGGSAFIRITGWAY